MRIYYLSSEYETGKHRIIRVWLESVFEPLPEDNPRTAINVPYTVLEIDERYNLLLCQKVARRYADRTMDDGTVIPAQYYVNGSGQLCDLTGVGTINLNPEKEAYKLSELYNMTQAQLEAYIDANVGNLAQARTFLKKLSAVTLWLVKQSKLG